MSHSFLFSHEEQIKVAEQEAKEAEMKNKEVVINQLKRRFKDISDDYISKLFATPIEVVNKIGEDIFDLESVEELNKYI